MTQLSRSGSEVIVRVQNSGEVLGTLGPMPGGKHFLSAQALDPCLLLTWDVRKFEAFGEQVPAVRRNAMYILAEHLRILEQRFLELATEQVGIRLARMLVRLLEQAGNTIPANSPSRIDLSQEELAQMIGTTLFTVSRLLCDWEDRGIIQTQRKAVLIKDHKGLIKLADNTEHLV